MLNEKEIRQKIFRQPDAFVAAYRQQAWNTAKRIVDATRTVAVFIEMTEDDLIQLFGSRAYTDDEPPKPGLFAESLELKASWECVKRGQTFEVMEYPGCPRQKKDPWEQPRAQMTEVIKYYT